MSDPTPPTEASPTPTVAACAPAPVPTPARPHRRRRRPSRCSLAGTAGFGVYAYNHLNANIATIDDTQDQSDRPQRDHAVGGRRPVAAEHPAHRLGHPRGRQRLRRRRRRCRALRHHDAAAHLGRPAERPGGEHPARLDGADAVVQDLQRRHEQRRAAAVQRGLLDRRCVLRAPHRRAADRHPHRPLRRRGLRRLPRHGQGPRRREGLPARGGQRHRGHTSRSRPAATP